MSKYRSGHRECIKKFIAIYKSEPSLWQAKSKVYHDRIKKAAAYERLVEILKRIEPDADRAGVVRKVNSLRSNYRKELNKVRNARQSGTDEAYVPKLWYFKLLSFLNEQETADIVQSETEENEQSEEHLDESAESPNFVFVSTSNNSDDVKPQKGGGGSPEKHLDQTVTTTRDTRDSRVRPAKRKIETTETVQICNESQSVSDHRGSFYNQEDRFDVFGKHIAMKLRDLPKQQRIIAEKLISETLFEAEMGSLTVAHRLADGYKNEVL